MKKTAKHISFVVLPILFLVACDFGDNDSSRIRASQNVIIEERAVLEFDRLSVGTALQVRIHITSEAPRVEIEADDNIIHRIVVTQNGDLVTIKLQNNTSIEGSATLKAHVYVSSLEEIRGSGATTIKLVDDLVGSKLDIGLSGASSLEGAIDIDDRVFLGLSEASSVDIEGFSHLLDVVASGASSVASYDWVTDQLNMELSGASNGRLTVMKTINYQASGASSFNYKGTAVIENVSVSGASSIQKTD